MQLVDPDGSPTAESRYSRELPVGTLCWLYEMMVVTRDVDAEFVNLQRQGELALFASCCGQEAAQVGAAACLRKTDWLFPQYRELGVYLVRGIAPGQVGAAWRGTWHGGLDFTKKCCTPMSVPIGTQTLHAVGAAMAAQRLGEDSTTVAFLGDCVARLIRDARAGSVKPAELAGSTFTVSNFGALGLDDGVPVINYPEAAILGMGSLKPRPAVVDDAVVIVPQIRLTCAFDHRIVHGANAAEFLGELRGLIESPETALRDL